MYNVCNFLSILGSHAGTQLEDNEDKGDEGDESDEGGEDDGDDEANGDERLVGPDRDPAHRVPRRRRNLDLDDYVNHFFKALEIGFHLAVTS